jgi:ribulose-phosphate 3-epimerase
MVMNHSNVLADLLYEKYIHNVIKNNKKIVVIGIDGPTAVGKTILADQLRSNLIKNGKNVWSYRLDWTLISRESRVKDLAKLNSNDLDFELEAELHMSLYKAAEFLRIVENFRNENELTEKPVELSDLYSRENNGTTTGSDKCILTSDLVILVEGHYSLRDELNDLIDLNILLLSESDELLSRKKARVSGYRGESEAEDYFWKVDLPSIKHHLERYERNVDIVIDNTDVNNPIFTDDGFINKWLTRNNTCYKKRKIKKFDISQFSKIVFSESSLVSDEQHSIFSEIIEKILNWDNLIGDYLRLSMEEINEDLQTKADELFNSDSLALPDMYRIEIIHTNTFQNVYHRVLPISLSLSIVNLKDEYKSFKLTVDSFNDKLRITTSWLGGCDFYYIERELGKLSKSNNRDVNSVGHSLKNTKQSRNTVKFFLPTSFTKPSFVKNIKNVEYIYTGLESSNINESDMVYQFLSKEECLWIHRFSKHSAVRYYCDVLSQLNVNVIKIGNYLLAIKSMNRDYLAQFDLFKTEWSQLYGELEETLQDESKYDSIIDKDRIYIAEYIKNNCPDFKILDSFLHSSISHLDVKWKSVVGQLALMMRSSNRLLRKRAIEFIEYRFPDFKIPLSEAWPSIGGGVSDNISIKEIRNTYPSIMSEVLLWQSIRGGSSAILGANIYDIRDESIDTQAHFKAATNRKTAVIIQSSLNAIGHIEDDSWGYLKINDSPNEFINAVINTSRKMFMSNREQLFYGIGIDHINNAGDIPLGRSKRFINKAMLTEHITYFVLDGEALFKPETRSIIEIEKNYKLMSDFVLSLLDGVDRAYIYDKEICISELNYIGKKAWIPSNLEVDSFVTIFREAARKYGLSEINTRPTTFIGNLGTTHHSQDTEDNILTNKSKNWVDKVKRNNFISAVLHGTTNTNRSILKASTVGCHKVNVAGDFLNVLVAALPDDLKYKFNESNKDFKYLISSVRGEFDKLSKTKKDEILGKVFECSSQLMNDIESPVLTSQDYEYFRYSFYKFDEAEIDTITRKLLGLNEIQISSIIKQPIFKDIGFQMSASMIEVPYGDEYKKKVDYLLDNNIKHFHIDVGDGEYITRVFSGIEKIEYIRKMCPDALVHVHLMASNPHYKVNNNSSYIELYIKSGADRIAVHRNSFNDKANLDIAINQIKALGVEAGIIVETVELIDEKLLDIIERHNIQWLVLMGVPIGFGGQIFNMSILEKISAVYHWSIHNKHPILIEVDGGLTFNNIKLCKNAGAQIFAGWSVIKSDDLETMGNKLSEVNNILGLQE